MFSRNVKHNTKKSLSKSLFKFLCLSVFLFTGVQSCYADEVNTENLCKEKKIKVAVISAGLQKNTVVYFSQILKKLGKDGFISENNIPFNLKLNDRELYKEHVTDVIKGKCLEFPDEFDFFGNWDMSQVESNIEELKQLSNLGKVDLIFSFGDIATAKIIEKKFKSNVVAIDVKDVARQNKASENMNNVYILDDTRHIDKDISVFSRHFDYQTIGYVRDKNRTFDVSILFNDIQDTVKEKGLSAEICEGDFFTPNVKRAREEFSRCMLDLSTRGVQAVFIAEAGNGVDLEHFYSQIKPLLDKKIAVISSDSKDEVRAGSLLSLYDPDELIRSQHATKIIEELIKGNKNVVLDDNFTVPLFVGINLKTASIIQWRPSFDLLVGVDDIFHSIESK